MKNSNDLVPIVRMLADALNEGITIGFATIDGEQGVVVADPASGIEISCTVSHPRILHPKDYRIAYGKTPVEDRQPATKWCYRFDKEKNIMKMTLFAMQDRYPSQESFLQQDFAIQLAKMMGWKVATAKAHITEAAKLGIINRAVVGTAYHITGVNDVDAKTAYDDLLDEKEPAPEQEMEKAVKRVEPQTIKFDENHPS